ncbi:hypothetical protein MMC09_000471 [Bachmanniomyces sp. S44760]|nr:hypothetical protein [Bachmanniomyces sp. S44760]
MEPVRRAMKCICQQRATSLPRTLFIPTAARKADQVQDLYIRELRNFKPTPVKPSDAEGHVLKFSPPKPPQSPEEANIANELKAYEDQSVEVEGQAASGGEGLPEEDWFVDDEEPEEEDGGH